MPLLYHIIYHIMVFIARIVRLWGRWQVRGRENVPKTGPLIVVANHVSLIDVPLVAISLGRKATFMAKEELFRSKLLGYIMYSIGSLPVRRGRLNRETIRQAQQLLAKGKVLVVFPEGKRSKNAQLQSALSGPALIAFRSGAPILPIGISGTEKLKSVVSALRRPRVTINIGHPFYLPPLNDKNTKLTKEKRAELTDFLMQHIAELLPPEYRGKYAIKDSRHDEN